jgi:hypothetical protein
MTIYVDLDGVIYAPGMRPTGFFDVNGDVYDKNNIRTNGYPMGVPCGFVDIVGDVYNAATAHIGFVDVDGTIYDFGMLRVGSSNSNGEVRDLAGNQIASVHLSLHQKVHKKDRRPMHFRVAGAIMFLINP